MHAYAAVDRRSVTRRVLLPHQLPGLEDCSRRLDQKERQRKDTMIKAAATTPLTAAAAVGKYLEPRVQLRQQYLRPFAV